MLTFCYNVIILFVYMYFFFFFTKRNSRIRGRKKPRVEWSNSFLVHRGHLCNYIVYICFVNLICQASAKNMLMVELCLLLWAPRCLFCFISQLRTFSLWTTLRNDSTHLSLTRKETYHSFVFLYFNLVGCLKSISP